MSTSEGRPIRGVEGTLLRSPNAQTWTPGTRAVLVGSVLCRVLSQLVVCNPHKPACDTRNGSAPKKGSHDTSGSL
ncbi:hypothetical protein AAFF_G00248810 [Aldrovandia affinis]|uniref:Uncharacterized protein n=1 Tax=Aldrovandia affinis TaxID=143900 RepID=A0AAD7RDB8_9TELE|nr:hypothetical protein AAFF_G00248810 [Aldrovandia affinis]